MSQLPKTFQPASGLEIPRYAGIPSFMRLPMISIDNAKDVDIALFGVPFDGGTTNRPGARHGPRQVRDASSMIRLMNQATGVKPFELANFADFGDSPVNPADVADSLARIERFVAQITSKHTIPMVVGGDHLTSLAVLRALQQERPFGLVHFDAHTDLYDEYFGGYRYTHGTPFRRGIEEGILDPNRIVQIGIRGTAYDGADVVWGREQGIRIVMIEELVDRGVDAIMSEARTILGDGPTYLSFDIDGIDPSQAPGTGTPEIGGFSTLDAQRMIRRLSGANLIGADLVEISPPFDPSGGTAYVGANIMFEIMCCLAEAVAKK